MSKNSSNIHYAQKDLPALRRLIVSSRANSTKRSWIPLIDTQSMSPSLKGDINLLIEWTQTYHYREGDLLIISKPTLPFMIAHRACSHRAGERGQEILQIADDFIFGDEISVSWIELKDIVGRVIEIRYGQEEQVATLESMIVQGLGSWIAKLSLQRFINLQNRIDGQKKINWFFVRLTTIQHRFACYMFRIVLYINSIWHLKTSKTILA